MRGKTLFPTLVLLAVLAAVWIGWHRNRGGNISHKGDDTEKALAVSKEESVKAIRGVDHAVAAPGGLRAFQREAGEGLAKSREVRERLREMQRTDDEGLEIVTMPDGHQSIDLKGRFHHVTRLVEAEDGSMIQVCGSHFPEEVPDE